MTPFEKEVERVKDKVESKEIPAFQIPVLCARLLEYVGVSSVAGRLADELSEEDRKALKTAVVHREGSVSTLVGVQSRALNLLVELAEGVDGHGGPGVPARLKGLAKEALRVYRKDP